MAKTPRRAPVKKKSARPTTATKRAATSKPKRAARAKPAPAKRSTVLARDVEVVESTVDRGRTFPIEIDPRAVEATLNKVKGELVHWANKGRYTKVRFKFRGKQLLPDLPLAAVAAAEGLTFYWGGILRALLFNVAGRTVLDVELVNDSEKKVQKGKEELLSGNLDAAMALFREAIAMDRDNAQAHLNLGVSLKLKGDVEGARSSLTWAKSLAKDSPLAAEAERLLQSLPAPTALSTPAASSSSNVPPNTAN